MCGCLSARDPIMLLIARSAQTLFVWTQTSKPAPLYEISTASWWEFEYSMRFWPHTKINYVKNASVAQRPSPLPVLSFYIKKHA